MKSIKMIDYDNNADFYYYLPACITAVLIVARKLESAKYNYFKQSIVNLINPFTFANILKCIKNN
jgi:hypothetical protein